jgi:hypothetical protein
MSNMQTPATALSDPLEILQQRYALFKGGGELWVVSKVDIDKYRQGGSKAPELMRRAPALLLMRRELENLPIPCRKPDELTRQFFTDPQTHLYEDLAFSPLTQPDETLNLWRPPPIRPKKGDWRLIRKHLFEVVCNSDRAVFSYLIRYLAHMLQKPEDKPGVMVVMLGGQGTGKGAVFQILGRIWRHSVLQVSDVDQVTGRFNAALGRAYVVCLDEAIFQGDRKAQDRLKSLITEPIISIEEKHQPQHSIRSFHRFFAATNHDHFASVENDDRRYFMLTVSDKCQQDPRYFEGLFKQIGSDEAIAGFIETLSKIDIGEFNPRLAPKTVTHTEQRVLSLSRFDKYWYQALWSRTLPDFDNYTREWTDETFIPTEKLVLAATKTDPGAYRYRPLTPQEVSKNMRRLCPSVKSDRVSTSPQDGLRRGFVLPSLLQARSEFEAEKKLKVDWDEPK